MAVTRFAGIAMPERRVRSGPAKGKVIDVEAEDNALVLLGFGNATFAVVDGTYCVKAAKGPRMEFFGSAGTINVNDRRVDQPPLELWREDEQLDVSGWLPIAIEGSRTCSLSSGVEHLADCIREGSQPVISAQHARHCLELMLKALEASRTGVTQELSTTF
jgi:predicted dehydrogenase